MECPLNQEEKELYDQLKGFEVTNQVYYHYINDVKGRSLCSREEVKKRLIKDTIIGYRRIKGNRLQVTYGCLYIVIDLEEKKFAYIKNDKENHKKLNRDINKSIWLKQDLGLVNEEWIKPRELENEYTISVDIARKSRTVKDFFKSILVGLN